MPAEIAYKQALPSRTLPRYSDVFQSDQLSHQEKIEAATTRLMVMLQRPVDDLILSGWSQALSCFSPQQLTWAFTQAELTLQAWPSVAKITEIVWEKEFHEDFAWLMENLRIHKPEWKDIPERKVSEFSESTRHIVYGIRPSVAAPEIPDRLMKALEIYGIGRVQCGLEALYRHPVCRAYQYDASEATRQQETIQRGFKSAYMQARSEI